MRYLLDTCVLSEFVKPGPEKRVVAWLDSVDIDRQYISALTLGEIQHGVSRLPASNRRARLDEWLHGFIAEQFAAQVLPLDASICLAWGQLVARLEAQGKTMAIVDSLIAATASFHRMTLVTRNVSDFRHVDIGLLNPWEDQAII